MKLRILRDTSTIANDVENHSSSEVLEKSFLKFSEDINLVAKCLEDIISSEKHLGGEEYNSTIGELWSLLESIKEREQNIGNEINNCIMHAQKELMANDTQGQ